MGHGEPGGGAASERAKYRSDSVALHSQVALQTNMARDIFLYGC